MYIYFSNNDTDIFRTNDYEELKREYLMYSCSKNYVISGQAEREFNKEMSIDGYMIIYHYSKYMNFYINENYIHNIIIDLKYDNLYNYIISVLKEKIPEEYHNSLMKIRIEKMKRILNG